MQIGIAVCGAPHCCVGRRRLQSLLQTCSCRSCLLSVLGGMCGAIALACCGIRWHTGNESALYSQDRRR